MRNHRILRGHVVAGAPTFSKLAVGSTAGAIASNITGTNTLDLVLPAAVSVDRVMLQEDLAHGQSFISFISFISLIFHFSFFKRQHRAV